MHFLDSVADAFAQFFASIFAIILAFVGNLTRLTHERAHGQPLTWLRVVLTLPSAILMGVVGTTLGIYLHNEFRLPEMTGGALGGLLGYLGPTVINQTTAALLEKWRKNGEKSADGEAPK